MYTYISKLLLNIMKKLCVRHNHQNSKENRLEVFYFIYAVKKKKNKNNELPFIGNVLYK